MIPIPDEDNSLFHPDHVFDQISMYVVLICLSIDFIYYITSVLFVRMWYEPQPSFLRICRTIGTHYILYWLIIFDVYVYSRTVHYTNNININLRNSNNDAIVTTIAMVGSMCITIGLVVFMTYHKLLHTRQYVVEGGPPLPMEIMQQQYRSQQRQQPQPPAVALAPMTIVITGANAGIGKETVRLLYQVLSGTTSPVTTGTTTPHPPSTSNDIPTTPAKIFLLCRSVDKGQAAIQDIALPCADPTSIDGTTTTRIEPKSCQLQVVPCDLCSFRSIRNAVDQILTLVEPNHHPTMVDGTTDSLVSSQDPPKVIHTLINNAGVMMSQLTYTNDDHHETCLQANFLGHFLLTSLLLPYISTSIINVTSSTYQLNVKPLLIQSKDDGKNNKNYSWNDEDIQCRSSRRKFSLFGQYALTKWCNILHTIYLSKYYSHLFYSSSIHPGLVRTDVTRNMPYYLRIPNAIFAILLQTLQKTPIQGAWNTVHVFSIAASWYEKDHRIGTNTTEDTASAPTESSLMLQRLPPSKMKLDSVPDWQNVPSGQYWVNRQPQPILSRRHDTTRIEEQAEAVWNWAIQQVHLTDAEMQRLQSLKIKVPSTSVNDASTSTTTASPINHTKVD